MLVTLPGPCSITLLTPTLFCLANFYLSFKTYPTASSSVFPQHHVYPSVIQDDWMQCVDSVAGAACLLCTWVREHANTHKHYFGLPCSDL